MKNNLLESLSLPEDLKKLSLEEEKELCAEIRNKIISTVAENGGHLSSNLGVVELTVAIHKVFESPKDKIVFDVGHQCYTHKLLTGRLDEFDTIRQKDGLSGFSSPDESVHDPVISGHSSTSISSALGIAQAMKLKGDNHHAIAVIGDGAMTGGLSYEGLNNAGRSDANIIVILNYNEMSISKNIGGLAEYLSKLRIKKSYRTLKNTTRGIISAVPLIGKPVSSFLSDSKDVVREKMLHSTLFEDLGFQFVGPVDGHDLSDLEDALSYAQSLGGPVLVQVNTQKGKGYKPAEKNPGNYHGVAGFDVKTGQLPEHKYDFTDAFGHALASIADKDERVCAITASMKYGTGLQYFKKKHPERYFDVGIAEGHAVTFAAGLAEMGMIPVFAVYSSFLQRSYDQLIHDAAIGNAHIVIGVDHAGIVGSDGRTHQGTFDIPFLTTIPNVTIYSPSNYKELESCLEKAIFNDTGIAVVRYPKSGEATATVCDSEYLLTCRGSDTLIISYGREAGEAEKAAEILGCDFMKLVKVFPFTDELISTIFGYDRAYIFEECEYEGSIGQKLKSECPYLEAHAINGFVPHMKVCEALELYGLSEHQIELTVLEGHNDAKA
ncbi:MAG: 1-deoxy-D-xylulose-5-phosphate synthase [Oscillospiraceae bacterium]|nr:1-deoxy-D-xylulose-5-phosphate synthase [Oscillospiraceae bacterium]